MEIARAAALLGHEKTTELVTTGIYRDIRHLLCLKTANRPVSIAGSAGANGTFTLSNIPWTPGKSK